MPTVPCAPFVPLNKYGVNTFLFTLRNVLPVEKISRSFSLKRQYVFFNWLSHKWYVAADGVAGAIDWQHFIFTKYKVSTLLLVKMTKPTLRGKRKRKHNLKRKHCSKRCKIKNQVAMSKLETYLYTTERI